jgi:hypothetical protein
VFLTLRRGGVLAGFLTLSCGGGLRFFNVKFFGGASFFLTLSLFLEVFFETFFDVFPCFVAASFLAAFLIFMGFLGDVVRFYFLPDILTSGPSGLLIFISVYCLGLFISLFVR